MYRPVINSAINDAVNIY